MKRFEYLISFAVILIPIGLFFWLANIAIVPSGEFVVSRTVDETSAFIDGLSPDARVEAPYQEPDGDWVQKIIGDPAFFFIHPQCSFDKVEAEIYFKNTGVPIFELGVLADMVTGAYTLEPLQNLLIDNSSWFRLEESGLVFLQREKKFASIGEFLAALPARSEIAAYHYNLSEPFRLDGYAPSSLAKTVNFSLRGSHEFYTYIKDETLNFKFDFTDDEVLLLVINEAGQPLIEETLSEVQKQISVPNLPEGVYKIQLKTGAETIFNSFTTSQQKIVFLNKLRFGGGKGAVSFITDGKNLRLSTDSAEAVQSIAIGRETVSIVEPYVEYKFTPVESGLISVSLANQKDLSVQDIGHFAFSEEQFFNPDPVRLTAETDLDRLGVNYIIAEYTPPTVDGEWLVGRAEFDVSKVSLEEKSRPFEALRSLQALEEKFVLSLPTIEEADREFLLNSIHLKFIRPKTTFVDLMKKIKNYVF